MRNLLSWLKVKFWSIPLFVIVISIPINIFFFSNCSRVGFVNKGEKNYPSLVTGLSCNAGGLMECSTSAGTGFQSCTNGLLGICEVQTCFPDFVWNNAKKSCDPKQCTPKTEVSCSVFNAEGTMIIGTGSKKCNPSGNYPMECTPTSCVEGYMLTENKQCIPGSCINGTTKPCETGLGIGMQTCKNNQWENSCQLTQCKDPLSYELKDGQCQPKINGVCNPGEISDCIPDLFSNGISGNKVCLEDGSGYGACLINACKEGYVLENFMCITSCTPGSTQECKISHGQGIQTCSQNGKSWSECTVASCDVDYIPNLTNTACLDNATPICNLNFDPSVVAIGGNSQVSIDGSHIFALGDNSITCDQNYGTQPGLSWLLTNIVETTSCSAKTYNESGLKFGECSNRVNVNTDLKHSFKVNYHSSGTPTQYSAKLDMDFNEVDLQSSVHAYVVALKAVGNNIEGMGLGWCYKQSNFGEFKWVEIDANKDSKISDTEWSDCSYKGAFRPAEELGTNPTLTLFDFSNLDIAGLGNLTIYAGYGLGTDSNTAFKDLISYSDALNPYGRYHNGNTIPYQGHHISLSGLNGGSTGPLNDYELEARLYIRSESYGRAGYYFALASSPDSTQHLYATKDSTGNIVWNPLPGGPSQLGKVVSGKNTYFMAAPELKNQSILLSDGSSSVKTDWTNLEGFKIYFGYGVGSTPDLAAQNMWSQKLNNAEYPHILQGSSSTITPTGNGDFNLAGTISGSSLAAAKFSSTIRIDSAHLSKNGAFFLVAALNGKFYCFQSTSQFALCDLTSPRSYSGESVVRLDADGSASTPVQQVYTGDFIPVGGAKVYLGYGVGNSVLEAFNEMMAYKSSSYTGRWNEIANIGFSPDVLRVAGPTGGSFGSIITSISINAFIQPEFSSDPSHRYYGQNGYRFILVQHKGRNFFRVKNDSQPFKSIEGPDFTGASYDGLTSLKYFNQLIYQGNATGYAGALVYVGYGFGSNETEAVQWALNNKKVSTMVALPTAGATIKSALLGATGNETTTNIAYNGSATLKFKALDAQLAQFKCLNGSTWVDIKSFDLSKVIDEEQVFTFNNLTQSYSCKLAVTGVNGTIIEKTNLNITVSSSTSSPSPSPSPTPTTSPTIDSFSASKTSINAGERINFSWTTSNATMVKGYVNGTNEIDLTPYGVDGQLTGAEIISSSSVSLKAFDSTGKVSPSKTISINVTGTVCSIKDYPSASCRYNKVSGTGVTKDGLNAWYKAVCLFNYKYYRCDGGTSWTIVTGY